MTPEQIASSTDAAPRLGRFLDDGTQPRIMIPLTEELHARLKKATSLGVSMMSHLYRLYDDGTCDCESDCIHGPRRPAVARRLATEVCEQVGVLIRNAICEAMDGQLDYDQTLRLGVGLSLKKETGEWVVEAEGDICHIVEDMSGITVSLG